MEDLMCQQCNRFFNTEPYTPKKMPKCGHTLCNECVLGLVEKKEDGHYISCPKDGMLARIELDINGKPKLETNGVILRMLQMLVQTMKQGNQNANPQPNFIQETAPVKEKHKKENVTTLEETKSKTWEAEIDEPKQELGILLTDEEIKDLDPNKMPDQSSNPQQNFGDETNNQKLNQNYQHKENLGNKFTQQPQTNHQNEFNNHFISEKPNFYQNQQMNNIQSNNYISQTGQNHYQNKTENQTQNPISIENRFDQIQMNNQHMLSPKMECYNQQNQYINSQVKATPNNNIMQMQGNFNSPGVQMLNLQNDHERKINSESIQVQKNMNIQTSINANLLNSNKKQFMTDKSTAKASSQEMIQQISLIDLGLNMNENGNLGIGASNNLGMAYTNQSMGSKKFITINEIKEVNETCNNNQSNNPIANNHHQHRNFGQIKELQRCESNINHSHGISMNHQNIQSMIQPQTHTRHHMNHMPNSHMSQIPIYHGHNHHPHNNIKHNQFESETIHYCLEHRIPADLVCHTDQKIICSNCALFGTHKGHNYVKFSEFKQDCRSKLQSLRSELKKTKFRRFLREGEKEADQLREKVKDKKVLLFTQMEVASAELIRRIHEREAKIKAEIENRFNSFHEVVDEWASVQKKLNRRAHNLDHRLSKLSASLDSRQVDFQFLLENLYDGDNSQKKNSKTRGSAGSIGLTRSGTETTLGEKDEISPKKEIQGLMDEVSKHEGTAEDFIEKGLSKFEIRTEPSKMDEVLSKFGLQLIYEEEKTQNKKSEEIAKESNLILESEVVSQFDGQDVHQENEEEEDEVVHRLRKSINFDLEKEMKQQGIIPKTPTKCHGNLRPVTEQDWEDRTPNSKTRPKPKYNRKKVENDPLGDLSVSDIQKNDAANFIPKISEEEVDRVNNSEFMEQDMQNRIRTISGVQIQESYPIYQANFDQNGGESNNSHNKFISQNIPQEDERNDHYGKSFEYQNGRPKKNNSLEQSSDNHRYHQKNRSKYGQESDFLAEIEEGGTFENLDGSFNLQELSTNRGELHSFEGDKENYELVELMEQDEENLYRTTNHEDQDERFIANFNEELNDNDVDDSNPYERKFQSHVPRSGNKHWNRGEISSGKKTHARIPNRAPQPFAQNLNKPNLTRNKSKNNIHKLLRPKKPLRRKGSDIQMMSYIEPEKTKILRKGKNQRSEARIGRRAKKELNATGNAFRPLQHDSRIVNAAVFQEKKGFMNTDQGRGFRTQTNNTKNKNYSSNNPVNKPKMRQSNKRKRPSKHRRHQTTSLIDNNLNSLGMFNGNGKGSKHHRKRPSHDFGSNNLGLTIETDFLNSNHISQTPLAGRKYPDVEQIRRGSYTQRHKHQISMREPGMFRESKLITPNHRNNHFFQSSIRKAQNFSKSGINSSSAKQLFTSKGFSKSGAIKMNSKVKNLGGSNRKINRPNISQKKGMSRKPSNQKIKDPQELNLSNKNLIDSQIKDLIPKILKRQQLRILRLSNNRIKSPGFSLLLEIVSEMPNLEAIFLEKNYLDDSVFTILRKKAGRLGNLRYLHLGRNRGIKSIDKHKAVISYLRKNKVRIDLK